MYLFLSLFSTTGFGSLQATHLTWQSHLSLHPQKHNYPSSLQSRHGMNGQPGLLALSPVAVEIEFVPVSVKVIDINVLVGAASKQHVVWHHALLVSTVSLATACSQIKPDNQVCA